MKVVLTPQAEADLRDIGRYIALGNRRRAVSFTRELQGAAKGLGQWPDRFPLAAEFPELGIRRRNYGSYAILYSVDASVVTVLRFLHGARDTASIVRR